MLVRLHASLVVSTLAFAIIALGCSSRVHEVSLEGALVTHAIGAASGEVGLATASAAELEHRGPTLSLIFIPDGAETLPVRDVPAADGQVIAELDRYTLDVPSTGRVEAAHGTTWVEVVSNGGLGWIPEELTTEFIPSEDFCDATEVAGRLIGELAAAIDEDDAERLAAVLSPAHGLRIRYVRGAEPVHLSSAFAITAMQDEQSIAWGVDPATGEMVRGSFSALVADEIADVITAGQATCNYLTTGTMASSAEIPIGEENLNFVSVHVPASEALGTSWVTWTIGFVFADGGATIATLNRYSSEG